jgi:hypothetical protein
LFGDPFHRDVFSAAVGGEGGHPAGELAR